MEIITQGKLPSQSSNVKIHVYQRLCVLCVSRSRYSSSMKTLSNKFMHLTNYSINKKNSEYQANSDDKACQGHKWYLREVTEG